jgi:hypothetical protein
MLDCTAVIVPVAHHVLLQAKEGLGDGGFVASVAVGDGLSHTAKWLRESQGK